MAWQDFTRLSVCSRSEVGSVNALVSTRQDIHHSEEANHEAKLRQSLERLHRDITRARDGEMQEKAVLLMEDALGLLAELEGDDGERVSSAPFLLPLSSPLASGGSPPRSPSLDLIL